MTEAELDLLQELLTERILRTRLKNQMISGHKQPLPIIEPRTILSEMLGSLRSHFKKPFDITEDQFTEVIQASCMVLRHIS